MNTVYIYFIMNWRTNISHAITGWIGGVLGTLIIGFAWPIIFPAIVNVDHYYGTGPGLVTILGIAIMVITPASLVGGLIGSRISMEGGSTSQRVFAAIFGFILSSPCACMSLWYFTGW